MRLDIITLFPAMFNGPFADSMVKRAVSKGLAEINIYDLRDFTVDKHRQVDDYPYGGGKGMVLKPEPLFCAVESICAGNREKAWVVVLSPGGKVFNQSLAQELAQKKHLILICGHYEGVDERVSDYLADDEISVGDFILTGGEIPAILVADATVRLLPGLLDDDTHAEESFTGGLLEYPQYTRPPSFRGYQVPEILLSGHHEKIKEWRREKSLERTIIRRPDLLSNKNE